MPGGLFIFLFLVDNTNTLFMYMHFFSRMGLSSDEANRRGFVFKNNPAINLFAGLNMSLNLAVNTAQYGRTFQDR